MPAHAEFADFCCELLASVGSLRKRRMFGGWGLSVDGLTIALVADLGSGARLWLKADADTRGIFEAAECARFTYPMRQGEALVDRSLNYYAPPDEAMDATNAMSPWARLALESALKVRAAADLKAKPRRRPVQKRAPASAKTTKARRAPVKAQPGKPAKAPQG